LDAFSWHDLALDFACTRALRDTQVIKRLQVEPGLRIAAEVLMRMLCSPLRSSTSASSRLPGGDLKNASVAAASNCVSLRVATFAIDPKRCDLPVS
jgi:hypothetical protein